MCYIISPCVFFYTAEDDGRFEPSRQFLARSVLKLQSYKVFTTVGRVAVVIVVVGSYYYSNEALKQSEDTLPKWMIFRMEPFGESRLERQPF